MGGHNVSVFISVKKLSFFFGISIVTCI